MKRCDLKTLRAHLGLHPPKTPTSSPIKHLLPPNTIPTPITITALDTEGTPTSISELGLATLDTLTLASRSTGPEATTTWHQQILARHFSITTTKPHQNHQRANNNSAKFSFGTTEHIPLSAIAPYLTSILQPPARQHPHIIVGHSLHRDLARLSSIAGYNLPSNLPATNTTNISTIDTLDLVRGKALPQKLSELWKHFAAATAGSETINFHNAGNDAVCNLQVLLVLAATPEERWADPGPGVRMPVLGTLAPFPRTLFPVIGREKDNAGLLSSKGGGRFRVRVRIEEFGGVEREGGQSDGSDRA